jgi:hypothetical protein
MVEILATMNPQVNSAKNEVVKGKKKPWAMKK